jgi:hypothetical protein
MKRYYPIHMLLTGCIVAVWVINGLICKILNLVPRHQQIVGAILGNEHAVLFTKAIGVLEILMAIWMVTGYKFRLAALIQIIVIAAMNCIEFVLTPGLLLFGRYNVLFAILLILVIYFNAFEVRYKTLQIIPDVK